MFQICVYVYVCGYGKLVVVVDRMDGVKSKLTSIMFIVLNISLKLILFYLSFVDKSEKNLSSIEKGKKPDKLD